jgi:hypothetical protein
MALGDDVYFFGSDRQSTLTKERRSLWFDKLTNRLSKRPLVVNSGAFDWFDWFDWLTNRRLVSLSNHRHRSNASAYFVDHHLLFHQYALAILNGLEPPESGGSNLSQRGSHLTQRGSHLRQSV